MSCPTARPPPSRHGCAGRRGSKSCAGRARPPTPRRSAGPFPTRCRSATAGICGGTCATRSWPRSTPHAPCWATVNPPRPGGARERATRERWHKVHALLGQGVGLLDCSRRLNLALNTVKRYARTPEPSADRIAPRYRPTLVDPYRDHLRPTPVRQPGRPRHAPPARDQGTGLNRQCQPAGPLPQSGPRRRRPPP